MVSLEKARKRGVPLVAIESHDPGQTIRVTVTELGAPAVSWDTIRGFQAINEQGATVVSHLADRPEEVVVATEAVTLLNKVTAEGAVIYWHNLHLYWSDKEIIQGLWNLRDRYKALGTMLVGLIVAGAHVPHELHNDIIVLTDSLPDRTELADIVRQVYDNAGVEPESDEVDLVCSKLSGMSAFAAEQILALSFAQDGSGRKYVDMEVLEQRANKMIEATPGLSVYKGEETLDDVKGYQNVKTFLTKLLDGDNYTIVFLDEIEKQLSGAAFGDTSGTSQDQLGALLTWMQDKEVLGILFIGAPGSGKSATAKAAGNRPTRRHKVIQLDLGAMKNRFVGSSEERIRSALHVIDTISVGKTVCIATCNSLAVLPPELRRRFSFGIFYFPLPTAEERKAIWELYLRRMKLKKKDLPADDGWTGAEIRNCCNIASKLGISLQEAARYIVPVSVSARDQIEKLEAEADGRYISASSPGLYRRNGVVQKRAINV